MVKRYNGNEAALGSIIEQAHGGGEKVPAMDIPDSIRALFHEYDASALNWPMHRDLIMQRIMEHGDWDAMQWLSRSCSKGDLRSFLARRGKKILPARELNYWALVSGIPPDVRHRWLQELKECANEWRKRYAH